MSSPPEYAPASGSAEPATPVTDSASTADMLRSMLSRAVEDQLVDQHEIAGLMGDMRNQLMRFGQEIADLRAHRPGEDSSDAQINSVTVELREAVRFLSERIDGVTRMVAQRGEDLADIRGALTAVDAHIRSQAETIGLLSAGLQSLPSYGEQVSVLADNLAIVHRQLVTIEGTIAASASQPADDRLTSIEASVAPLGATVSELSQTVSALQSRIEPLASDVTTIGANVAGLVEGTADGAALDSRVRESVGHAVRDTEQRLINHIDEAVLALAQTLLKRRPVSIATPVADPVVTQVPAYDAPPQDATVPEPEPEPVATDSVEVGAPEPAAAWMSEFAVPQPEPAAEPEPEQVAGAEFEAAAAESVESEPAEAEAEPAQAWISEFAVPDAVPQAWADQAWAAEPMADASAEAALAVEAGFEATVLDDPGLGDPVFDDTVHEAADTRMLAAVDFLASGAPLEATEGAGVAPEVPSDVERISVAPSVVPPARSAPEAPEAPEAVDVGSEVAPAEAEPQAEWVADGVLIGDPPAADSDGEPAGVTPLDTTQPRVPVPVPGAPESAPAWPPQLPPERAPVDGTVVPDEVPETKRRWFRSS
jgi:hypothetical protein